MARPDRMRKAQVRPDTWEIVFWDPTTKTMSQEKTSTTQVRMAVATLESVFRMPHLARMEVSPAKSAEAKANKTHMPIPSFPLISASILSPSPSSVTLFVATRRL